MTVSPLAVRTYYDGDYHFAEDAEHNNPLRIWHAMRQLAPLASTTFLDLGCGVGWATRLAVSQGHVARAVGLDFSHTALELAAHLTPPEQAARIDWVLGDGTRLPFPDASFDRVFSFGAMEHFSDVRAGFAELARVLRPDGVAASVVPNFYARTEQPLEHRDTYRGWRRLIQHTGLRITRVCADLGPPAPPSTNPLRLVARSVAHAVRRVPGLCYQFVFVMRKL